MAGEISSKDQPIIIVGSGVFGLSTAIHLAKRGYCDVTVFDKQPYDSSRYSYFAGADAASADLNKIVRSAYGAQTEYQDLSTEAIAGWHAWNAELAAGGEAAAVPPGMSAGDRVFIPNGNLSLSSDPVLPAWELACIEGMERAGHRDTQLDTTDPRHRDVARRKGVLHLMDPFRRRARGKPNVGVLDTTGGTAVADKACRFALHKARSLGVRFVLGPEAGHFAGFTTTQEEEDDDGKRTTTTTGIRTADGKVHRARMTVMACGGWTPVLVRQLDGLAEATAGSVALLRIPRASAALWDRLGPDRFPTWTWDMRAPQGGGGRGGLYGFARDEAGWLKVGYRGAKYTNPVLQGDGRERSTPATRWGAARRDGAGEPVGGPLTGFPAQAHRAIARFLDEHLPELAAEGVGVEMTRMCWYTDTPDNHFVVDRVPGTSGLMVATGGSGHAFKYLPNIGKWVVDVMEGVGLERPAVKAWRWRAPEPEKAVNHLMEGSVGSRALENIAMLEESAVSGASSKL
ncbi:putative sarcosine oxidase [Xylariaceae sp. FL0804]|nr:putative sarcosine oxidase [Xylariaceae sp. FL0804]